MDTMKLSRIKTSDSGFEHCPFDKKNPWAYLSAVIRWFAGVYYNHAFKFIIIDGVLKIIEAVKEGVVIVDAAERLKDIDEKYLLFKRRKDIDSLDEADYIERAKSIEGLPYDKDSLLLHEPVMQIARKFTGIRIWIGRVGYKAMGKFICYEVNAWLDRLEKWWSPNPKEIINHLLYEDLTQVP